MFTTEHFIWMGLCAVLITIMSIVSVRLCFSFRTSARIMAGIALVSEVSKIISDMEYVNGENAEEGMVLDAGSLPLHLCSLLIFVFLYLPFARNEKLKSFFLSLMVPVGLIGSAMAILMATSGTDFTTIDAYQCFVYHAGMTWFAVYLVATKQVDLGLRAWRRNLVTLLATAIGMIWVNSILQTYDTNFWYVVRPPVDNLPVLNLNHGWFAYFGTLLLCGFVGLTVVHLPFMLRERGMKNREGQAEI